MRSRQQWPSTVHTVAAVAAGIDEFALALGALADGVIGPSQWEPGPGMHLSDITGPKSDWFVKHFQERFGRTPGYVAAGSFATGLIVAECIGRAASLDNRELRRIAAGLDCNTFYGGFRIDPETGKQVAHRMTLVRWQQNRKVVLSHWHGCGSVFSHAAPQGKEQSDQSFRVANFTALNHRLLRVQAVETWTITGQRRSVIDPAPREGKSKRCSVFCRLLLLQFPLLHCPSALGSTSRAKRITVLAPPGWKRISMEALWN
jgi:Periplasmic binding protein